MNDNQQVPKWPAYVALEVKPGIWMASTQCGHMTLAVSASAMDAAVKGLFDDVKRETGANVPG